jgi:hypothetical protein
MNSTGWIFVFRGSFHGFCKRDLEERGMRVADLNHRGQIGDRTIWNNAEPKCDSEEYIETG